MFYVWLIPVLVLIAVLLWMFFAVRGAPPGRRSEGTTVHDRHEPGEDHQ